MQGDAPFPQRVEFHSDSVFEFTAQGTWNFPANTSLGERARIAWLSQYLAKKELCPFGYKILKRTTSQQRKVWKHGSTDDEIMSITYDGSCLARDSKDTRTP